MLVTVTEYLITGHSFTMKSRLACLMCTRFDSNLTVMHNFKTIELQ